MTSTDLLESVFNLCTTTPLDNKNHRYKINYINKIENFENINNINNFEKIIDTD